MSGNNEKECQAARWAIRLLERVGLRAASDRCQTDIQIQVDDAPGGRRWRVEWRGGRCDCRSLGEVGVAPQGLVEWRDR